MAAKVILNPFTGELELETGGGGGGPPTGPAGGDLSGTYPDPTVVAIEETSTPARLAIGAIADGQLLSRSGLSVIGVDSVLRQIFYVDPSAAAGGNGSWQRPFNTVQAAVTAASSGGAILLNPSTAYPAEALVLGGKTLSFAGLGGIADLSALTLASAVVGAETLNFQNVIPPTITLTSGGVAIATLFVQFGTDGATGITAWPGLDVTGMAAGSLAVLDVSGCAVGALAGASPLIVLGRSVSMTAAWSVRQLILRDSVISKNITVSAALTANSFYNCLFSGAPVFTGPVGSFDPDGNSWASFLANGGTLGGGATVTPLDAEPAGGDLSGAYPNPNVAAIHETGGPTKLTIGAIADTQTLRRAGAAVTGVDASAPFGCFGGTAAAASAVQNYLNAGPGTLQTTTVNTRMLMVQSRISRVLGWNAGNAMGVDTLTVDLWVNNVVTAQTISVAPGATSGSDSAHPITIPAGANVNIGQIQNGTEPNATQRARAGIAVSTF